jgi:hypothetical protein
MQKLCPYCMQQFETRNPKQKFCSVSHGALARPPDSHETRLKKSLSHQGEKHYRWNPDREDQKIRNRLGNHLRKMLKRALDAKTVEKTESSFKMLGYTPQQLREHLEAQFEPWMSWENWGQGPGTWQVDHIRLVSSFSKGTPPSVVNALSNLRPLAYEANMKRPKFEG